MNILLLLSILTTLSFSMKLTNNNRVPKLIQRTLLADTPDDSYWEQKTKILSVIEEDGMCPTNENNNNCISLEPAGVATKMWCNHLNFLFVETWSWGSDCSGDDYNLYIYTNTDCCPYTSASETTTTTDMEQQIAKRRLYSDMEGMIIMNLERSLCPTDETHCYYAERFGFSGKYRCDGNKLIVDVWEFGEYMNLITCAGDYDAEYEFDSHECCSSTTTATPTTDICYISSDRTKSIELNTCTNGEGGALSDIYYCDANNNFVYSEFDGSDCVSGKETESDILPHYKYCCEEPEEPTTCNVDTCFAYSYNFVSKLTGETSSYEGSYSELQYCDGNTLVLNRYLNKDDCTVTKPWHYVQTYKWINSNCCQ